MLHWNLFRKPCAVFATVLTLALALNQRLSAHPYPSGVANTNGTISFILNEPADDVTVKFDNATVTTDLGSLAKGVNSFGLGSHTNYSIIVIKSGTGTPSQISADAAATTFHGPRAVAVNKNINSVHFGRTYVLNSNPGTDTLRATQRGVYVLNADQSDAFGYGNNAYPVIGAGPNQIQYGSSTTYGPYKIFVGPDDAVYVADASGSATTTVGGGVWLTAPDLTTAQDIFPFNGTVTTSAPYCVPGTPNVTGSYAAGNLTLYITEWNRLPYNNIWQYQIGGSPLPFVGNPIQLASAGINNINEVLADLYIAPDGKFFTCEHRLSATGGNVSLRVFASDGITALWDSSSAAGGTDPFFQSYGMAVSPDDLYVATGTDGGNIDLCQLTNGVPDLSTFTTIPAGFGGECAGVAWDMADNVYGVSGTDDLLRVFSLGLSTKAVFSNDATGTNGSYQFVIGSVTSNSPPVIVTQPQPQNAVLGTAASLSVAATGTPPLIYQWIFNTANVVNGGQISGATTNVLSFASVAASNTGNYTVVISNAFGSVTSSIAKLTVTSGQILPLGWSQITNSPGVSTVRHDDIYFTDPINGWASQNNNIYRTTNGGYTWTTNLTLIGTHFRSIGFATPMIGFGGNLGVGSYDGGVTDNNVLYRTLDGGVTWSNVPGFAEVGMKGLCSIFVLDSQHIYGAGRVRGPAFFIKSTDGGFTWSTLSLTAAGVMNGIMDIYFQDTNNGWVVGMDTNAYASPPYYGRIARTTNGGASWTTVLTTPIASSYFWKMSWPSTNIGYVSLQQNAGYANVVFYKTTNGGANWFSNAIPLSSVGLGSSQFYLQGLGFVSTNEGWIGGASGFGNPASFLHTVDGGVTWSQAGFNNTQLINRIRFMNPNLGFASGANLYVYNQPIVITNQPAGQVALAGGGVNLSVGATSLSPLGYQWQMNGTNIGVTNAQLSLTNITRSVEGVYSVLVTNANATLQSSNVLVRIIAAERLAPPVLLPGGQLQLLFNDADGGALLTTNDVATFQVLVSTNFTDWTVLTNALTLTNGSMILHDTWTNSPSRFYRVLEH